MIKFLVKGQDIETLEHEVIAADQVSFVNVKFAFDNNWKPLHKVVKFVQECDEYFRVLGVDGTSCYLPAELHPGAVKMSLFGYDPNATETVRATTVIHTLHVRPSGFEGEGSTPVPPTPDLYQQLLEQIGEAHKGADGKSAFEIAVEHGYVGTVEQWLESLRGKDGAPGENGRDGQPGENGADGKSAYELAVEQGYSGTEAEWFASLKGTPGTDGHDGADGQPGADGHDGKSAYEIAVEHGYTGTEEEWIAEMKPDMSNYYNKTEVTVLVERKIEPTQEKAHVHENKDILDQITEGDFALVAGLQQFEDATKEDIHTLNEGLANISGTAHTHENKAVLDSISAEDYALLDGLQQFEDSTQHDIQSLNEAVSSLNSRTHTHSNKAVLDSITQADKTAIDSLPQFKDGVETDIQELRESVSTVVEQAHWHHNLTVLNSITAAKVAKWDRDIDLSVYATKDYADGLSTQWNDRLTYEIQEVDARFIPLENKAHTHGNSAVLDALTAAQVAAWVNRSELGNFATNAALTYGLDTLRRELTEADSGLSDRITAVESELEGIETILRRVVG